MYRLVPFKAEHVELMDVRPHEAMVLSDIPRLKALEAVGVAVTGIIDGVVVCCGGVVPMPGGNADIWLLPSIHLPKFQKTVVPALQEWLFGVRENFGFTRMESTCLDDDLHNRWMEYIGFECEGLKRKFFMGNDYKIWGKLWE